MVGRIIGRVVASAAQARPPMPTRLCCDSGRVPFPRPHRLSSREVDSCSERAEHERHMAGSRSLTGRTISHYCDVEKIGGGGMSVVYKAEDTRLHRAVGLKFQPSEMSGDSTALGRFRREAQAAWALNHPNIRSAVQVTASLGRSPHAVVQTFPLCRCEATCLACMAQDAETRQNATRADLTKRFRVIETRTQRTAVSLQPWRPHVDRRGRAGRPPGVPPGTTLEARLFGSHRRLASHSFHRLLLHWLASPLYELLSRSFRELREDARFARVLPLGHAEAAG